MRLLRIPFALAVSAALLPGCASHPVPAAPEPAAMTASPTPATPPASVADNPALSVEEIGRRFLRLFEGLESRDDLTLEYVERIVGVKLEPSDDGTTYNYVQRQDGGWRYSFAYRAKHLKLKNAVSLKFVHRTDEYAEMTPVCALNFEHYRRELERMDFVVTPRYGEIGELRAYLARKILGNGDLIHMTIIPQNRDTHHPEGKVGELCIYSIGMPTSM